MSAPLANEATVMRFNDAITARDIDLLATWMTDDHEFVDTAGGTVTGKDACLEAWRGFFRAFPDYKNVFQTLATNEDVVVAFGYSTCSEAELDGPAIWTARMREGKVAEWRVYDDTTTNRSALGIGPNE